MAPWTTFMILYVVLPQILHHKDTSEMYDRDHMSIIFPRGKIIATKCMVSSVIEKRSTPPQIENQY